MLTGTKITTQGVLYINGQQVENTFTNISKITRKLEGELKKLPIGTKEFIDKANEVKQVRARFEEAKKEIAAVNSTLEKTPGILGFFKKGLISVGDTFRQVFTADLASRFFDIIITKGGQTVDELLKISDAMSDVQKTSGMTLDQVKDLWDSFDEMDTRTEKLDRLKIAEIGGRLGVPVEQMKDFVQEIDKAYVALGDSFEGGLEGVVDQLGKIKGLFNDTKELTYAEAINKVGSALNTLAAQGTASEGNISQFTLRMGALGDSIKPALDKVLGLGAAFEESGIDAQIASSGVTNFLSTAGENIDKFAYSMHMSKKEARELFNTKPEEFFLKFAEGMRGLPGTETAKILKSLGLESLEVQKVVGAAANSTDKFRTSMQTAGEEMEKMTSLQIEFDTKNNNSAAIWEKIKNVVSGLFTSTNVINFFEPIIKGLGWLTGVTKEAGNGVLIFRERLILAFNIIKIIAAGIIGYNTVLLISAIAEGNLTKAKWLVIVADKAQAAGILIKRTALLLYNVVLGIVTLNMQRVTAATIAFNVVTKLSPWGIIIGLVTAAFVAYKTLNSEIDKTTQSQKLLNSVKKEAKDNIAKEISEIQQLVSIAKNENIAREKRLSAIKRLNEISPEMLGNLTLENIKTKQATEAIKNYIKALEKKATAEAFQSKRTELIKKRNDEKSKTSGDYADWTGETGNNIGFWLNDKLRPGEKLIRNIDFEKWDSMTQKERDLLWKKLMPSLQNAIIERAKNLNSISGEINTLNQLEKNYLEQNPDAISEVTNPTNKNIEAPDDKKNRPSKDKTEQNEKKKNDDLERAKAEYSKALEASGKNDKELLDAKQKFIDEIYKTVQAGKQKEWDLELQDFQNKKYLLAQENSARITANEKLQNEIDKLSRDSKETKNSKAQAFFDKAIQKKDQQSHNLKMVSQNQEIEEQMFQTHGFNLLIIEEKWETIKYQKKVEALQEAADLERKSSEDMINNISSVEDAKIALSQMQYLKLTDQELSNINTLEAAKKALRENADRAYLDSQLKVMEEFKKLLEQHLKDPSLSPEAIDKLKKDLADLQEKMTAVKGSIKGNKEADDEKKVQENRQKKGSVDLLGYSVQDWEDMFNNLKTTEGKIKGVIMVTQALANATRSFAELQRQLGERDIQKFEKNQDIKKKDLLKQLNQGFINNEEYHKQLELLDQQTARKRAEIAYKQAKAEKAANIMSAIAGTASAVVGALGNYPWSPVNFVLASLVGAMGALQIATIAAQPLPDQPSFAEGGFTPDISGNPDDTGEVPVGYYKLHRKEWVAPRWMRENPRTANVINWLESVRQGGRNNTNSFAEGGNVENATNSVVSKPTDANPTNSQNPQLVFVLSQISDFLEYLKNNPLVAEMYATAENGKLLKKSIESYDNIRNRASGKSA